MTMTLTELTTTVTTVLQSVVTWIPTVFNAMVSSPIVMIFIAFAIVGTIIAFARKILL